MAQVAVADACAEAGEYVAARRHCQAALREAIAHENAGPISTVLVNTAGLLSRQRAKPGAPQILAFVAHSAGESDPQRAEAQAEASALAARLPAEQSGYALSRGEPPASNPSPSVSTGWRKARHDLSIKFGLTVAKLPS